MFLMIQVGIVGASGYTGEELIKILHQHPNAELRALTSSKNTNEKVRDVLNLDFPYEGTFCSPDIANLDKCDVVFFATPNGIAMGMVGELIEKNIKVIDISADYRIKDIGLWEKWYGQKHLSPELVNQSVYGLPEMHGQREKIASSMIVGNPGCYPTSVLLALLPIINYLPKQNIIIDAKSGVSGAGRNLDSKKLFAPGEDNFQAYAVKTHRHYPEIMSILQTVDSVNSDVLFVPHLSSMIRGIYSTAYVKTSLESENEVSEMYEKYYENSSFVEICSSDIFPRVSDVSNTNKCMISLKYIDNTDDAVNLVIFSVIDNLVKGASGQAVQNMNIMFNLDEKTGLN